MRRIRPRIAQPSGNDTRENPDHPAWNLPTAGYSSPVPSGQRLGLWNTRRANIDNAVDGGRNFPASLSGTVDARGGSSGFGIAATSADGQLILQNTFSYELGSFDFWVMIAFDSPGYVDSGSSLNTLFAYTNGGLGSDVHLNINSSNTLYFGVGTFPGPATVSMALDVPHVAVAARVGSNVYLWLDGQLPAVGSVGTLTEGAANAVTILNYLGSAARAWRGRVYCAALAAGTMQDHVARELTRNPWSLFQPFADWRFVGGAIAPALAYASPVSDYAAGSWLPYPGTPETVRNTLTYTEAFDNAAWTKTQATITANATTDPVGGSAADKLVESAANNVHSMHRDVNLTASLDYTLSVYAKPAGRDWVYLQIDRKTGGSGYASFNVATGVIGVTSNATAAMVLAGNGFYRCSIVVDSASGAFITRVLFVTESADNVASYAGDGTSGVYLWGAQLEQASAVSAYQPIIATTAPIDPANLTLYTMVDEAVRADADYAYVLTPGSTWKTKLDVVTDPSASDYHKLRFAARSPQAVQCIAAIYQGSTLIATTTVTLTTGFAEYVLSLSGAEADAVTNYGDLYCWLTGVGLA